MRIQSSRIQGATRSLPEHRRAGMSEFEMRVIEILAELYFAFLILLFLFLLVMPSWR